jgi:hypothetical protein
LFVFLSPILAWVPGPIFDPSYPQNRDIKAGAKKEGWGARVRQRKRKMVIAQAMQM